MMIGSTLYLKKNDMLIFHDVGQNLHFLLKMKKKKQKQRKEVGLLSCLQPTNSTCLFETERECVAANCRP